MGRGRQTVSDFLVDTNGYCFMCLSKPDFLDDLGSSWSATPTSYSSVHSLSQYLEMDMSKVFHDKQTIPSELLDNVKQSKLKAPLCEQCAKWNERIAELCRQMQKIETEVTFYLELVQGSLLRSNGDDRTDLLYQMGKGTSSNEGWTEKVRIVKALRKEAVERCSHKLSLNQPKVKIHNLNANQVFQKRRKIRSESGKRTMSMAWKQGDGDFSTVAINCPAPAADHIKEEGSDINNDDYFNDYNDDDGNNEYMEDTVSENEEKFNYAGVHESDSDNRPSNLDDNLPTFQTKPAAATTENIKRAIEPGGESSSSKVAPSTRSTEKVQELKYDINPETGKFQCNICSAELVTRPALRRHYDSLHLKIKYKCITCGKEFGDRGNYGRHHRTAHVGVRFKCNLCGTCFTSKQNLLAHQKSVHLGK